MSSFMSRHKLAKPLRDISLTSPDEVPDQLKLMLKRPSFINEHFSLQKPLRVSLPPEESPRILPEL